MRKATCVSWPLQQYRHRHVAAECFKFQRQFCLGIISRNYHLRQSSHGQVFRQQWLSVLLQQCSKDRSLETTKCLHALAVTMGSNSTQSVFLYNNVLSGYVSLAELSFAKQVFDEMPHRNVVSYNAMIGAYTRNGNVQEAWELFYHMRVCRFEPNSFTFGGLLSCGSLDLVGGFCLQALIIKNGMLYSEAYAGTALVGLFGRNERIEEAVRLFQDMPLKNLVTWNSMISIFGHYGFRGDCFIMFRELIRNEGILSEFSLLAVLSGLSCQQDLILGEQLHGLVIKYSLDHTVSVANSLVNMYAKCSGPYMAEKMFEQMLVWNVISWNTIIGAFGKSDKPSKALVVFLKMCENRVLPSQTTFVSVIDSCTSLQMPMCGEFIHAKVIKNMLRSDMYVGSALVNFYSKQDKLEAAHSCFNEIFEKNLVCWNALILGYVNRGCSNSVFLMREMIQLGYHPNEFSFSIVIKSTLVLELRQLHSLIIKLGFSQNDFVSSSLINSYAKHGLVSDALMFVAASDVPLPVVPCNAVAGIYNRTGEYHKTQELFTLLHDPDIVSWNILIAACSRNGDYNEVFELFKHMRIAEVLPDNYTYISLFSACTKLCNLALGMSLHGLIIKTYPMHCETFVFNIMIDMYGKCGSLGSAIMIFYGMTDRNIISWTALISALGLHGYALDAVEKFREMEMMGFKPDGVAFIAVLSACRHAGLVNEGMEMFKEMQSKYSIEPGMDHYHLVVDMLARYGHLKEAEELIAGMHFPPNALIWRSFLEGCRKKRTAQNQA